MDIRERQKTRIKQLTDLSLKFDGESFIYDKDRIYINFHHTDVLCFEDDKWDREYNKAQEVLKPTIDRSKLLDAVLAWWEEHKYDSDTVYDREGYTEHYNRYNEPPEFVRIAQELEQTKS